MPGEPPEHGDEGGRIGIAQPLRHGMNRFSLLDECEGRQKPEPQAPVIEGKPELLLAAPRERALRGADAARPFGQGTPVSGLA